ncbi:uncharacterized protein LOC108628549 isoform X2 [Ceratina calcarata]|uniref:Uncharacterized protein LOC108628549 isoform X2 n=1 Tax=Ceratina calcarata TaxID=156304 RepID=A0AAJ7S893_9HYME|nr:uncharacterized protein LOC108628549 isoform X2 [Ceratina calcarata]
MLFLSRVLALIGFTALISGQDTKTVFPFPGNGSSSGYALEKAESVFEPEVMRTPQPLARLPTMPVNYFLSAPQRTFIHHRSDGTVPPPYVYDHPHYNYPMAHSIDYPVAPSMKPFVIVSFIGLLLLFAIIQNTLASVKRRELLTDVLSARKKRELYTAYDTNSTSEQEDVLDEDARVRCIQRTVCLENRKLVKAFGATGKILAKYLTRGVERSLKPGSGWDRLVRDAGEAGIRGEECELLYRDCDEEIFSKDDHRD